MKKIILLLVGLIPSPLGYYMNHLMTTTFYDKLLPYKLIGIILFAVYFLLGRYLYDFADSCKKTTILANSPAFIVLLLILFQELILGSYFGNQIGIATQFYYLPLISMAKLFPLPLYRLSFTCVFAFLLMSGTFYLGCRSRKCAKNKNCTK